MKRNAWIGLGIAVAIVAAAAPIVTGRMTESRVRELLAGYDQTNTHWKATIASYDRSWLRSESVVRFRSDEGTEVAELRTTWRHGPVGGVNLASGSSELRLVGPLAAFGRHYYADAAPVTASHTVALDQSLRVELATPRIDRPLMDAPDVRVIGSGSSGTLTVDRSGRYALDHRYPTFMVRGGPLTLDIDAVTFASDGRFGDAAFRSPAQFSLSAKSFRWGDRSQSMAFVEASISGKMTPHAESIDLTFGHVVGPGHIAARGSSHRWKRFEFRMTLSDISLKAVEGYSREMRSVAELPESDPRRLQRGLAAVGNATRALLERDPTLSLDTFTFDGPEGTLTIVANARIDRAMLTDGGLAALPLAISILARVSVARALAQAWLDAILRPNAAAALTAQGAQQPSPADVDRWTRTMVGNVLAGAAQAGLIREGADPIVIEIVAKEGSFLANGLTADRLAELRDALMPDPAPKGRDRAIGGAPPIAR